MISGLVALFSAAMLVGIYLHQMPGERWYLWLAALAFTLVHALLMFTVVTEAAVKEAAFQYGRQLVLACETLMRPHSIVERKEKSPRVKARKKA